MVGLRPNDPVFERAGKLSTIVLGPTERSTDGVAIVEWGKLGFQVLIEIDFPGSAFPMVLEVDGPSGPVYREPNVEDAALLQGLHYEFYCPAETCPPGRYTVRLTGSNASQPPVTRSFDVVSP